MEPTKGQSGQDRARYAFNLTLAAVAGQVGCFTLVIVIAALLGGLWLDAHLGTKPIFTIGLVIASVPVTLVGMIWIVRTTTSRISPPKKTTSEQVEGEN